MPKPKKVVAPKLSGDPVVSTMPNGDEIAVYPGETVEVHVSTSKPTEQRPTGKFEKLLHDGRYYLVNVDGRILSSALTEDAVDRMVMNLNNKRR